MPTQINKMDLLADVCSSQAGRGVLYQSKRKERPQFMEALPPTKISREENNLEYLIQCKGPELAFQQYLEEHHAHSLKNHIDRILTTHKLFLMHPDLIKN